MITCVVCHNRESEGELFCSECGARLSADFPSTELMSTIAFPDAAGRLRELTATPATAAAKPAGTAATPTGTGATPAAAAARNAATFVGATAIQHASAAEHRPGQITLLISGAGEPVILEGRTEYILGREGNEQVVPDLNLNDYGARDKGVSRVHAALRRESAQLLLVDLGSTNGTRLNGHLVPAHQPVPVSDGDEIQFGKLLFRISFMF